MVIKVSLPLPFIAYYRLTAYFRYRSMELQRRSGLDPFVIDWPWIRYTGWMDSKGQKCGDPFIGDDVNRKQLNANS